MSTEKEQTAQFPEGTELVDDESREEAATADAQESAGESQKPERTFTQAQLNAIVAREKQKATNGWFSADDMAAKDASIANLTAERDTARSETASVRAEITALKREKLLLSKGVAPADVDYYSYKIGKLVTDDLTFEQAAAQFFRDSPVEAAGRTVRISTGGSLEGRPVERAKKPNEKFNDELRRAFWNR